jgi:predicted alpha/beta superfamily hydrolase
MNSALRAGVVFQGPLPPAPAATQRFVRVYLPASYDRAKDRRYPVLYVHDGQNAFTTAGPDVAFGWGNWEMDRIATELAAAGRMREIILVAIDCTTNRYRDYRGPARRYTEDALEKHRRPPPAPGDDSLYQRYRTFLVDELKPWVDREYRTLTGPKDTGVIGSSMGGLCSLALAWDRPDVFGQAASLSGAFQVEQRWFVVHVLRAHRDAPKPFRAYLDSGVVDFTGGDDGRKDTEAVVTELRRIGWKEGVDLMHFVDEPPMDEPALEKAGLRRDKWGEARNSQHNEFYWRQRVWRALTFLYPQG